MKPVAVIGMGLSAEDFTAQHWTLIRSADLVVGGERHLSAIGEIGARKVTLDKNLAGALAEIREYMGSRSVVVIASGDPLFYGIGAYLIRKLGKENVRVLPNVSSVGAAFARIGEPWHDAEIHSFHGRPIPESFDRVLVRADKIALLTDLTNTPSAVAERMIASGEADFRICVLERMGAEDEKIEWYSPGEVADGRFADPNVMILLREKGGSAEADKGEAPVGSSSEITEKTEALPAEPKKLHAGSPESWFAHERGLITKAEVRAVTLSKLRLDCESVLWDLGAGSGSVSVEAGLQIRSGRIIAVEKNGGRLDHIRENRERFGIANMEIVHRELPDGLETLPEPDRVFIGGGGRGLETIIRRAAERLRPSGIMVVNTVILQSMDAAVGTMEALGLEPEVVQLQVSRCHKMPHGRMLKAQNPVWIISGTKVPGDRAEG